MLIGNRELSAEDRLLKAVVTILAEPKYTALAGVLMIGERTVEDDVPTACTNGRDEQYGRKFIEGITDPELRGLVLHENYHKLYRHLTTWRELWEQNAKLANVAMDFVINLKIVDENKDGFAKLPEGGCISEAYRGMNTKQVWDSLLEECKNGDSGGEGGGGGEDGEDGGDGGGGEDGGGLDEHDWEGAKGLTSDELRELERDIDEAIRQGALAAGKMGQEVDRDIGELLKPQVDWRELLREFLQTTCAGKDFSTWKRPNRRYIAQGVYLPSGISETVGELVLAIDTSGSIGQRALTVFLSEVKSICDTVKPSKVRLLYWGHKVVGDESYSPDELGNLINSTKPIGGGGTDVECVVDYMRDNNITPQATIVLTDGDLYGGWGVWTCPILWAVLNNPKAKPPLGKVAHIKSGDM